MAMRSMTSILFNRDRCKDKSYRYELERDKTTVQNGNISMCLEMKFYCNTVDVIETQIADILPKYLTPIP